MLEGEAPSMPDITIVYGPHVLAPAGTGANTMRVDEDSEIEVLSPKTGKPTMKRAGDVDATDQICFGGHCLPFNSSAPAVD
jgi:hypothetical protein